MNVVEFHLPGKPRTRKEPLWGKRGPYPHPQTKIDQEAWRAVWFKASAGVKIEGPVCIEMYIRLFRPNSHLNRAGDLNAEGKRFRYPPTFDLSNCLKLLEDSLQNLAFGDDSMVVAAHLTKRYVTATSGFLVGTTVAIRSIERD